MAHEEIIQHVLETLESRASVHDIDIVLVEVTGPAQAPTLGVRIDNLSGEAITLDEVEAAATWIEEAIDELDPFAGSYMLEVSSPGIDRPLRRLSDFIRFVGETVQIQTNATEGRKKWTGDLLRVEGEDLIVQVDGTEEAIPFSLVKSANIKGKFDFKSRKDNN